MHGILVLALGSLSLLLGATSLYRMNADVQQYISSLSA